MVDFHSLSKTTQSQTLESTETASAKSKYTSYLHRQLQKI